MEKIDLSERSYGGEMRIEQHSLDNTNLVSRDNSSLRLFSESRTRLSNDELYAARHYQKKRLRIYDQIAGIGMKEDLNAHTNDSTED